jgi:ribonuclease G
VIVRTAAEDRMVAELDQEIQRLTERWESSFSKIARMNNPGLVLGELDRATVLLRDIYHTNFNSIIVNDTTVASEIAQYLESIEPEKKKIVKIYRGKQPVFEHYGIDKQIKSSFGKTVSFKNGAYLIIEHTEAFHVIDVNSGNRAKAGMDQENSALDVNMAACEEISRQLRLRDMGGIIVIDFIDMNQAVNRHKVYEYMKEVMEADRTKHNILPLSKFCLMQITRQRVRQEENIETAETCPTCNGSGKVVPTLLFADEISNKVIYILKDLNKSRLTMKVHPFIAAYLTKGFHSPRINWLCKYRKWVRIKANNNFSLYEYQFLDENEEEIIL